MRLIILLVVSCLTIPDGAAQNSDLFDLIDTAVDSSPAMAAARAAQPVANARARALRASSYEVEVFGSGGQRETQSTPLGTQNYSEWSVGASRTIRLPGKRSVDLQLSQNELDRAETQLQQDLLTEKLTFIDLWTDWALQWHLTSLAQKQSKAAHDLSVLAQQQVDLGAARQIDADRLKADAEKAALSAERAMLAARQARLILETRYPNISLPTVPLDVLVDDRVIAQLLAAEPPTSPAELLARLTAEQAQLSAQRARRNRLPDPTVGVEYSDEFGGQENSVMARISIPIGGRYRSATADRASSTASLRQLEYVQAARTAQQRFALLQNVLRMGATSLAQAEKVETTTTEIANRLDAGYRKNAVHVDQLIRAQMAARMAERERIRQQSEFERSVMKLVILSDMNR